MSNFLVFSETFDGNRLAEALVAAGETVCAGVADEKNPPFLPNGVKVVSSQLEPEELATLLTTLNFDCAIDATRPDFSGAGERLRAACAYSDTRCLRLLSPAYAERSCVYADHAQKAADILGVITGRVLLAIGHRELEAFVGLPDFSVRLFPRIPPSDESLRRCLALGYRQENIIAMQGPFTREMNAAMLRQTGASVLVTRPGVADGFSEKLLAAQDTGATVVVVGKAREKAAGGTPEEIRQLLNQDYGVCFPDDLQEGYPLFPLFVDLHARKLLVFGGNAAAARAVRTLFPFCRKIRVIAPQFDSIFDDIDILRVERPYLKGDCEGFECVFAFNENREVNHAIYEEARAAKIPVFVSDAPDECTFHFPMLARSSAAVIGVYPYGAEDKTAKAICEAIQRQLEPAAAKRILQETGEKK